MCADVLDPCVDSVDVAVCGAEVVEGVLVECGLEEEDDEDDEAGEDNERAVDPKPPRTIVPLAGALNSAL